MKIEDIDLSAEGTIDAVIDWTVAMDALTPDDKMIIAAFIRGGFSNARGAEIAGLTRSAFAVALHRVRAKVHSAWAM